MAEMFEVALAPISPEAPCGPDLELVGDQEFMNFMAAIEGQMPASFFSFDRKSIDFSAALETLAQLRKRTQDLRLILLAAKLAILNRDFLRFVREVAEIAWLLTHRWEAAHPQGENGDFSARLVQLGTLDDGPTVVLPLQYATLVQSEREGPLAFRAVMVMQGDAKMRESDRLASAGAIERMMTNLDVEALANIHGALSHLADDLASISQITGDHVGSGGAVKFSALTPLVEKMRAFLQDALARRDPSYGVVAAAAQASEAGDTGDRSDNFASLAEVDAALASALGYFQANEPSSPALLLIVQARATLGKNLYEVMRLLAPRHANNARVFVGPTGAFSIPVSNLQDAPALDFSPGEAPAAESRNRAFALVEQVAAHLRKAEPSSPAPYLLDRARSLASRDFLALLGEVFAPDELESMKAGN